MLQILLCLGHNLVRAHLIADHAGVAPADAAVVAVLAAAVGELDYPPDIDFPAENLFGKLVCLFHSGLYSRILELQNPTSTATGQSK